MLRFLDLLIGLTQVLSELLAWSDSDDLDGNVDVDLTTRQLDHPTGEVDDGNGLSHLQHEDVSAFRQQRSLQHELNRFFDAHEKSSHPRIGDSDGPPRLNLASERGDDAAPAPEDVAEPDSAVEATLWRPIQQHLFCRSLGGAHDA